MWKIERVANGWLLAHEGQTYVFSDFPKLFGDIDDDSEAGERRAFLSLVWKLANQADVVGSRYDQERFFAELRPGDKAPTSEDL